MSSIEGKHTADNGCRRDRRETELQLQESERFQDIVEKTLLGVICEMDLKMNVTFVNQRGLDIFGYSDEDLKAGIKATDIVHPEEHDFMRKEFSDVLAGDYGTPEEYRCMTKDGRVVHMLVNSSSIIRDAQPNGIRTCLIDISALKKAQAQFQLSEERFRRIFSQSPIGIGLFEADGNLIEVNQSFREMFGTKGKASGYEKTFELHRHINVAGDALRDLTGGKAIRLESEYNLEITEKDDAKTRYFDWHITSLAIDREDAQSSVLLIQVQDITERKLAQEAELKRAHEATEKANRLVKDLKKEIIKSARFHDMVSRSPAMKDIFNLIPQMAETDATVLVSGESGTGKELIARSLHAQGPRKSKPFLAINCSALPDNLLESELFGYKAGAFTDAKKDKPGKFALAEGGTLFLDEIGDMSAAMQVKLLRVLQERTFEPLGGTQQVKANVRVVAATNRDLQALVKEGEFREDLYYRIKVLLIKLPPLRERRSDIPLLCDHFINIYNTRYRKNISSISDEALGVLLSHDFPGNIRELENIVEHAFIFCKGDVIEIEHLPPEFGKETEKRSVSKEFSQIGSFKDLEKAYIQSILEDTGGNKSKAAKKLGIHKATLFRKIKQLGIQR
ncbi:MAG: PAS domain S-box protein [Proteobacteria bacterium]|nr:PAS domain S-box protein [Pseudomonadota bacterium]